MIRRLKISPKDKEAMRFLGVDIGEKDETDLFDYSGVVIEKPWGYEYSIFKNNNVDVWLLRVKSGHKTSMHCHPHKKTSLIVLSGEATVSTLNEEIEAEAGTGFLIDKGVFHATKAVSPRGILMLESETPVNKKNLIRLDDSYGREKKRYESGKYMKPRDKGAMPCFYVEETIYGEKKNFGKFNLQITKYTDLQKNSGENAHAIIVLNGNIKDGDNNSIFEYGDILTAAELRDVKNNRDICGIDDVDLLLIFKE